LGICIIGAKAAMTDSKDHLSWFRRLDRIFWLIWAALPVMIWLAYLGVIQAGTPSAGMTPEQAKCFEILPTALSMSAQGKTILWSLFAFEISIYFVLFGILHRMVHRFATGRVLVSNTLANLQLMGIILIAWPVLDALATNLAGYFWQQSGDMLAWQINYVVDLAPIAVGVFLIALKGVLEHAIALKAENDLTI
jgi:Protein of unknown function (DUF2975)